MKYIDENKLDGLYDGIRCFMCSHLVNGYYRGCDGCCDVDGSYGNVCHVIQEFLTNAKIEAEPVKHGHWIEYKRAHYFKCSLCKAIIPHKNGWKYYNGVIQNKHYYNHCPECGAKMDEVENDEV